MPKLVAMMIVRNEANRYLSKCLDSLHDYVDEILVVDDHSTDHTPEICLSYPRVRLVRKKESTFWIDESSLRRECWNYTISLKPDWILAIDADELMEEGLKGKIRELLKQKEYQQIAFRLIEFWGSYDYYRVDKLWNPKDRWVTNLINYQPTYPYRFSQKKLHCGRLPINLPGKTYYSPYHLKHYGYANSKEHVDKFLSYIKNDPYGENCPLSHYLSILDSSPKLEYWGKEKGRESNKKKDTKIEMEKREEETDLIIVNHNTYHDLKRCIEGIREHTNPKYHLIVVDNHSSDGSREYLESQGDMTCIFLSSNTGYATAANRGIKEGKGEYIFILNPDILVTKGWLEPLLRTFKQNQRAAVVGPKLLTPEGLLAGAGVVGTPTNHQIRGFLEPDNKDLYQKEEKCLSISGACYGIQRSLIPIIGLFDESFFLYFEETDYSLRAQRKGYEVIYCPYSLVYHDMRWEERDHQILKQRFNHSKALFEKKWAPSRKNQPSIFKKKFGVLDG